MHTALWAITGVLAAGMLLAGAMKLAQSKDELKQRGIELPDRFSDAGVKALGLAEVLGAAGLILPGIPHRATLLVPIAALGTATLLSCGVIFHVRRHDGFGRTLPTILLLLLSVVVVWARFGTYAL
jgi:hypothetical protein